MQKGNYNSKRRNPKKGYGKGRTGSAPKDKDEERASKPQNDPAWYSKYPQLVNDTGNLFFSNPLGAYVPHDSTGSPNTSINGYLDYVPGIIALNCLAVPGFSRDATSPVNAVARGIYSYIRHANSGHSNYASPDLMMYLLAMDSCYSFWATCVRAYGVARLYNIRSRYLSKEFLTAMNFDADDIINNLAQFRANINTFAVKLGSYAVPASMDYFRRHTDMYTKVFLDEPSAKAQSYMFNLAAYYCLNVSAEDGTKLLPTNFPQAHMTVNDVQTVFSNLLDPILNDEDMNIMSGDILKAYGDGGIFKVPMINEDYTTPFVFDEVVLSQIENSYAVPTLNAETIGITQDPATDALLCAPMCAQMAARFVMPPKILNIHHDNPSAMDVMEATRLMYSMEYDASQNSTFITNFGAELVISYELWTFTREGLGHQIKLPFSVIASNTALSDTSFQNVLATMSNISTFNFHPRMTLWSGALAGVKTLLMDNFLLDNYTVLEDQTLANISNTAMLSLFDVGHIALQR